VGRHLRAGHLGLLTGRELLHRDHALRLLLAAVEEHEAHARAVEERREDPFTAAEALLAALKVAGAKEKRG
jgi:hypothetical protein